MDKIAEFKREGRTIVFVSHSADQIKDICDRVVVLAHGSTVFDGSPVRGIAALRKSFAAG